MQSVSICIANYKQDHFLDEAIYSCHMQTYKDIEICIFNDTEGVGSGEAFNRAIAKAKGDIVVLLCADDCFTDKHVIEDMVKLFESFPKLEHVSRYYYQFIGGDDRPVRAWRGNSVIELANNPSGLAFRRSAIKGKKLTNKMFIEAPYLVSQIKNSHILRYDTVAVRIHQSTARTPGYYKKMWTSSPIEEWSKIGGKSLLRDYTSLIQIKNYFTTSALIKEIWNFIRLRPMNLLAPGFWFFAIVALVTPRPILYKVPELYRSTIGRWTTRKISRP